MNTVQPIRSLEQIEAIKTILKNENVRDYLLFVLGVNTGLRISDLLPLKYSDIITGHNINESFYIREQKTGKEKTVTINETINKAIIVYLNKYRAVGGNDYLFPNYKGKQPISRQSAWKSINAVARRVGITENVGCHTLRKSWGYHALRKGVDIAYIMEVFNHSSQSITKRYIGITDDEIKRVYHQVNI